MPKLRVKISEKELAQLKNGEVVNIGKFAGMDLVELEVDKSDNDELGMLILGDNYVRVVGKENTSFYQTSDLKDIPNPKLGDIAICDYGYCKYDGIKWLQVLGG